MLANERFVANAPAAVVDAERDEARALPARARWHRRLTGSRRCRRGRPKASGSSGCRRCSTGSDDRSAGYDAVHVVGTKGKSTAARTIAALLRAEGVAAATYTSPHVSGWAERLETDAAGFERAVERVRAAAEEVGATQFEILTGAALLDFAERGVDVAVLEAGLGGRLDATNVVDARVVLLTNVGPRAHGRARRDARGDRAREARRRRPGCDRRPARTTSSPRSSRPNEIRLGGAREAAAAYLGRPVDRRRRRAAAGPARAPRRRGARRRAHPGGGRLAARAAAAVRTTTSSSPRSSTTRTRHASSSASRGPATRSSRRARRTSAPSARPPSPSTPPAPSPTVATSRRPDEALAHARSLGRPVLVTGSLYLLADLAEKD